MANMAERTDAELFLSFADLALEAGRADVAGECLRRAAITPNASRETAEQLHAAGIQFLGQNKLPEAETLFGRAIRLKPDNADWHDHLGVALARQKRLAEAEVTFALAVRINPALETPRRNWVQSLIDSRKFTQAEQALREAVNLHPQATDLQLQLNAVLGELKQHQEAISLLEALVKEKPGDPQIWNRLGVQYGHADQLAEAERCFQEQIRIDPNGASGYANLAAAVGKQKKWKEAIDAGLMATKLEPNNPQGWANLGNAQRDLGRLSDALKSLQEAMQLDPNSHEAAGNLALTIAMMGRPHDALPWYEHALKMKPDVGEIRFNRAVALLWIGDYERGWAEYEWRWLTDQMKNLPRKFAAPYWDGSSLHGKTILVHSEQGHGDTIQFCRFVPKLVEQGAKVVLTAPALIADVIRTVSPEVQVITSLEELGKYDVHCPLMSLPYRLRIRLDSIPNKPYLASQSQETLKWKERLAELPGRKVGLVWQGNPGHIGDRFRSIPLKSFQPLMALPGISWISLQKGPGSEQLEQFPEWNISRFGDELTDFNDTAGLLQNLDLLISVDTGTVHLMGALGKPVWALLAVNNDWRWLLNRSDSPWYPSAKLFRQQEFGNWSTVIEQVKTELSR
jgi:tetratricopeptide (TPR) repeat protein